VRVIRVPFDTVLHHRFDLFVDFMLFLNALVLVAINWAKLENGGCSIFVDTEDPRFSDGVFEMDSLVDWVQVLVIY
jgi:hypothetical protein